MVLWQHVVLCKSTLLRMCLVMVCVMCHVVTHDAHVGDLVGRTTF